MSASKMYSSLRGIWPASPARLGVPVVYVQVSLENMLADAEPHDVVCAADPCKEGGMFQLRK